MKSGEKRQPKAVRQKVGRSKKEAREDVEKKKKKKKGGKGTTTHFRTDREAFNQRIISIVPWLGPKPHSISIDLVGGLPRQGIHEEFSPFFNSTLYDYSIHMLSISFSMT